MKIVLLPGLDGTGILFQPFIEALPDDVEILVISYPSNLKLNYDELVNYVMSQLPEDNFILVGESFSGPIAYQVALRIPENIKSVVFVATFLNNPRPFLLKLARFIPTRLMFTMPYFIIKSFLLGWNINRRMIGLFKQSIQKVSPDVLSFRLQEIARLRENNNASKIRSSYIQATNDKLVPKYCVNDFKKSFNNINVFEVKGPHFILQANPKACANIVANEIRLITNSTKIAKLD